VYPVLHVTQAVPALLQVRQLAMVHLVAEAVQVVALVKEYPVLHEVQAVEVHLAQLAIEQLQLPVADKV
jgi:hypothetical protein